MFDPITLDQLRVLATVVDEGSFSAAARKLRRVQSAVSTSMANHLVFAGIDGLIDWHRPVRSPLAQLHQSLIDRDPDQPRVEFGASLEVAEMGISLQESFLQDIFRIVIVLRDLLGHPEHAAIIVPDQFRKCVCITRLGAGNQGRFVETRGYS